MSVLRLQDRNVLITGAESGIGRATALRAAREGAHIGAIGLDGPALETLVEVVQDLGRRCVARQADVTDERQIVEAVDDIAQKLGGLDVVHANAGIAMPATPVDELSRGEWDRVLAVNLTGVFLTLRAGVPHLRQHGGLLLVTGSSMAIRPGIGMLAYVAAKAGVHTLARSLALELAPESIRVNVLAPGLTETPLTLNLPGHIERGLTAVPLGEVVNAEDVAALAVHLMSDEARHITGSVFSIDGGRTAA